MKALLRYFKQIVPSFQFSLDHVCCENIDYKCTASAITSTKYKNYKCFSISYNNADKNEQSLDFYTLLLSVFSVQIL